eukprot:jgi/Mesvir1/7163/Mv02523-RA.1
MLASVLNAREKESPAEQSFAELSSKLDATQRMVAELSDRLDKHIGHAANASTPMGLHEPLVPAHILSPPTKLGASRVLGAQASQLSKSSEAAVEELRRCQARAASAEEALAASQAELSSQRARVAELEVQLQQTHARLNQLQEVEAMLTEKTKAKDELLDKAAEELQRYQAAAAVAQNAWAAEKAQLSAKAAEAEHRLREQTKVRNGGHGRAAGNDSSVR